MNTSTSLGSRMIYMLVLGCLLGLMSCTTSKSLMKDGLKYESSGMYEQAVKSYKASLARNISNVDSRSGLNSAGQQVLNDLLDEYSRSEMLGEQKTAVYKFKAAEDFKAELKKYGVSLDIQNHYYSTYAEVKSNYLYSLYQEGTALLEVDDFEGSKTRFREILAIDPEYRDVAQLKSTSVLEPKYREAKRLLESGQYRQSYFELQSIAQKNPDYKDIQTLRAQALEQGEFVMALMPFENATEYKGIADKVQAYTLNDLTNLNNPFLKVVDRQHLDQILAEQDFSLSGMIDNSTAVEVGNLTGSDAILVGQVIDYRERQGRVRKATRDGYESYVVTERDEEGKERKKTKYRPVKYTEYVNDNSAYISFHIKLINLETSEVLISEVLEKEIGDDVKWVSFSGNTNRLFPSVDNRPVTRRSSVNELRALLNARRELSSMQNLSNDAFERIADRIATRVDDYLHQ